MSKIIICGSIAIDRIMDFSGSYKDLIKPDMIHTLSVSVFLNNLRDTFGGVGANIAYTLGLLGEKPVLVGSLGKKDKLFLDRLTEVGVDVSNVHLSDLPTASFNVITDMDNNQVGGFYPGAMFDSDSLSFESFAEEDLYVIAPHDPKAMRRQVEECQARKLKYFYDIGQQVSNTSPEDLKLGVDGASLLIINDYEISVLAEKVGITIDQIKNQIPVVVTTLGKEGSIIEGKEVKEAIKVGIAQVETVVDPTGAGDAYRAGFLYGFVRGWELEKCGKLGAVASTYAIEKLGTQEHTFTKDEFAARFESSFQEKILLF